MRAVSAPCGLATYVIATIIAAFLTIGATAVAQTADTDGEIHIPELRSPPRLLVGAGGGLGFLNGTCDDCRSLGGIALEFYVGYKFHRRVALLFDTWTTAHFLPADSDNPGVTGYVVGTAAVQAWITPIVFVRAGVGLGALAVSSRRSDVFDHGPGMSLVVGGEIGHRKNSGIDLSARFSGGPSQYSDFSAPLFYTIGFVITYHRNFEIGARPIDRR